MGLPGTGRLPFGGMSGGVGLTAGGPFFFLRVTPFVVFVVPGCEGLPRVMEGGFAEGGAMANPLERMIAAVVPEEDGTDPRRSLSDVFSLVIGIAYDARGTSMHINAAKSMVFLMVASPFLSTRLYSLV
jgi:hypothetical protein